MNLHFYNLLRYTLFLMLSSHILPIHLTCFIILFLSCIILKLLYKLLQLQLLLLHSYKSLLTFSTFSALFTITHKNRHILSTFIYFVCIFFYFTYIFFTIVVYTMLTYYNLIFIFCHNSSTTFLLPTHFIGEIGIKKVALSGLR